MDRQPQASQGPAGRDSPVGGGPGPVPCPDAETPSRPALRVGPLLVRTVRHFFRRFNDWLDDLPDPRDPARRTYDGRFLLWVGLFLFLCKLGSRRQIDFQSEASPAAGGERRAWTRHDEAQQAQPPVP